MPENNNKRGRITITAEMTRELDHDAEITLSVDQASRIVQIAFQAEIESGHYRAFRSVVGEADSEVEFASGAFMERGSSVQDAAVFAAASNGKEFEYRVAITP
jgi:hypothetical protein